MSLESNERSNRNLSAFLNATSTTDDNPNSTDDLIRNLTEDCDAVMLAVAPVTNKIQVLHSMSNLGGTRSRPDNKLVALDGFGERSNAVLLGITSLQREISEKTPSLTSMQNLDTREDIMSSSVPRNSSTSFKNAAFILIPPFLANGIITQEDRDPATLLYY